MAENLPIGDKVGRLPDHVIRAVSDDATRRALEEQGKPALRFVGERNTPSGGGGSGINAGNPPPAAQPEGASERVDLNFRPQRPRPPLPPVNRRID